MFPEPGGPMFRRPPPPPGALGPLPPPGALPPGPMPPRGLPMGPHYPLDMAGELLMITFVCSYLSVKSLMRRVILYVA